MKYIFNYVMVVAMLLGIAAGMTASRIERKQKIAQFTLDSQLESAYSKGFWRGFNSTIHYYPPCDKKIELRLIFDDYKSYREVLKEEEKQNETK